MKQNPKSLSKIASTSNIKFKLQSKQSEVEPLKQLLRKSSSSLKLNMKNAAEMVQHANRAQPNTNAYCSSSKQIIKTKRVQTQTYQSIGKIQKLDIQVKAKKNYGWTEIDKIKYELTIEKRLRESLERENQTLKKQISFLNNFGTSMRTSVNNNKKLNTQQVLSSNKEKILSRLNKKRDGATGASDNDSTGVYSAKTKYYEESVNQMYEQYAKKRIVPNLESVYQVMNSYFNQFKQNYSKLFILFNQSNQQNNSIKSELTCKIEDLLFLFQVPILYKERPKQLLKSVSKQKLQSRSRQSSNNNSFNRGRVSTQISLQGQKSKQEMWPQYKSPKQIFEQFEVLFNLILRNNKLFAKFMKNELYHRFVKKIKDRS